MARASTTTRTRAAAPPAEMNDGSTAGKELTVQHGGSAPAANDGPKTVAQQNKEKLQKVLAELAKRASDYEPLLRAHNIPFDVFTAILQQALIKVPFTLKCTTASILQACMRAAADGLFPDGDECALVPFKNGQTNTYEATYVPGYKGMLKCAYAMHDGTGAKVYMDVDVDVIYEGEEGHFKVRKGTDPSLTFEPPLNRDINKKVVGAYAVVRTNNGGVFVEVIGEMELGKIANVSKAKGGPRGTWGAEMHKKGPLRRLLKRTPKDQRLARLMVHDEEAYLPGGLAEVEGDVNGIPDDKLFEDTAHQVEDQRPRESDPDAVARARADLMAAETEAQLDEVVELIGKASGAFTPETMEELLRNAQTLRMAKFGGAEGGADQEFVAEGPTTVHDDVQDADFVQEGHEDDDAEAEGLRAASEAQDRLDAELAAARPTETDGAPSAPSEPATSASATPASTASPAASSSSPGSSRPPSGGWKEAPAERRVSPAQAMLDGGVHFKEGIGQNGHGQIPYFNDDDEIVGWAKPDLDIPTRPMGGAPAAAEREAPSTSTTTTTSRAAASAEPAAPAGTATTASRSEPQIRSTPEDRQEEPPPVESADAYGEEEEDGYGEETPKPAVFRLKVKPADPPREYADPVEWRDAIIYKMSSLKGNAAAFPRWWGDNKEFVIEALQHDRKAAGRVIVTAVTYKLPGAAELVDQYGPF